MLQLIRDCCKISTQPL